jgi:ABC-type phosphate transport system auxiliary subunit
MDITAVHLRNAAENLVRSTNSKQDKDGSVKESHAQKDIVNFSSQLTSRYILLQNKLSTLQHEYTREQTRLSLLANNGVTDEELVNILYGGAPLFTESIDTLIGEKESLLNRIRAKKEEIADQIRALEVESENIFSINTKGNAGDIKKEDIAKVAVKPLDVKVVEKLIKG